MTGQQQNRHKLTNIPETNFAYIRKEFVVLIHCNYCKLKT